MSDLWTQLLSYAVNNELFAGLMGASLLGSAVFMLRPVPKIILFALRRQFTVELQVDNTDEAFRWLSMWLAFQPYARRARRLTLSSDVRHHDAPVDTEGESKNAWTLLPGEGLHWFWHRGRLLTLQHEIDRENSRGTFTRERLVLRAIGRRQDFLRGIVEEAEALRIDQAGILVKVYSKGWWQSVGRKEPRPPESVILEDGQVARVIADARRFFESADWYAERGVPFRRSFMFSGPPGTGKTSLALALATTLKRPLYLLNLGGVGDDDALLGAFLGVPAGAILLIEDVDMAKASHERRRKKAPSPKAAEEANTPEDAKDGDGITLSALLNAIDGAAAPDGRLLVMTTNYPDKLDGALTRPGRVDRHEEFKYLDVMGGQRMCARFKADSEETGRVLALHDWPRPAAEIQQALIQGAA